MHTSQPTIKDIAARLGVAPSTVSRALSGSTAVSERTREQVKKIADDMGYVLNLPARLMHQKRNSIVGLLVPDIRTHFHAHMASVLAERSRAASFQMIVGNTDDDPAAEEQQVRAMLESRVAGIIITPTPTPLAAAKKLLERVPTVQLLRVVEDMPGERACMDEVQGTRDAVEYLFSLGHRRIAYVGTAEEVNVGRDRVRGFRMAHENAGITPDPDLIFLGRPKEQDGYEGARRVLAHPARPTALFIASDRMTVGGLRGVKESGLAVPRELSVIGYGDSSWLSLFNPPLTHVVMPVQPLAENAASALFRRITGQGTPAVTPPPKVSSHLVIRESCAPPAAS